MGEYGYFLELHPWVSSNNKIPTILLLILAAPLQIVGAYTKSLIQNSEEVQEELKKQLAAFDKYLKDNKKHIGGELLSVMIFNET